MSTKFRQSVFRLFVLCRPSLKHSHKSPVLFCQEYALRPTLLGDSRTGRLSYQHVNNHQFPERKFLLAENTPTPMTALTVDTSKFIF